MPYKLIIILMSAALVAALALCGYLGRRIASQNESIQKLYAELESVRSSLTAPDEPSAAEEQDGDAYSYLAIGNSITLHGCAEYWWDDDRGMAASSDEKDYVHLVASYLSQTHEEVKLQSVNFYAWEVNANDRAEAYSVIDPYLSELPDLITVQLGENATELDTWEADWKALLEYIKGKCPDAEILVIGDFWSHGNRDWLKEKAALSCGVKYVSLEGIKNNTEYYAGIGTTVEGKDSSDIHTIEHSGVAKHPGDKGMQAIADRITDCLKQAGETD